MSRGRYDELRETLAEIGDLSRAAAILGWDQQTMMPPRGAAARAEQLATLGKIAHQKFTAPEVGKLIDELRPWGEQQDYDSIEASLIRRVARDWEKSSKVPSELRAEMSRSGALALPVWVEARENDDWATFLPVLRKNLELRMRYVECFDGYDEPYDVLLDDYEPGMKSAEVRRLFDYLKEHQAPLVQRIAEGDPIPASSARTFPLDRQRAFELEVVRGFGFDDGAWRLDPTVHPFASGGGIEDIRITTRYFEENLDGLFATMHETGHGLYEHQIDLALDRTPLARGVSLGMHESQSRMWENLVGRSLPFWKHWFPRLQETFPEAMAGYEAESWYREVNTVEPSLIRVEADEATYNLHIILRFELEQAMLSGEVPLDDLPEAWNERMQSYIGVQPPDNRQGVLQDVHWAGGAVGYFPTYALGNLIGAQIWEKVNAEIPDLSDQFEAGEFGALRDWLRENLHRYGRKYTPQETLEKVVGTDTIDPEPYVRYLREKLGNIYGITVSA